MAARSKDHFLKFKNAKNNLTHAIWAPFFLKFSRKKYQLVFTLNFIMAARSKDHFRKSKNTKNNLTHAIWVPFFLKFSRKKFLTLNSIMAERSKDHFRKSKNTKNYSNPRNMGTILPQIFTKKIITISYTKLYHGGKMKGPFSRIKKHKKLL